MPWAYFERVLKRVFKRSRLTARCISLVCRHGQRAVSLALVRLAGRAGIQLITRLRGEFGRVVRPRDRPVLEGRR